MHITFAGACGTVTGSRYLLEVAGSHILIDCGLYQGPKALRLRNWMAPHFDAKRLDAVVLTHAHIDHSGYLPRLLAAGFHGRVFCTTGTCDLLQLLLPDSGYLQEEEARHANEHGYAKHHPALPLYTRDEALHALELLSPVEFHAPFEPAAGISASFTRAGHILGAACLKIEAEGKTLIFSGDVGRPNDPVLLPPEPLPACDYLVLESTYGDRRHPSTDPLEALSDIVQQTHARGGTLLVPAFAVGRSQQLLRLLSVLREQGRLPDMPIHLDSPMAIGATEIFGRHANEHRLTKAQCEQMFAVAHYAHSVEDSKAIDRETGPQIVISASGMATGGRVLHHLRRFLPEERNSVLLVGYQAAGTRGRSLLDGTDELKLQGEYVRVRARIYNFEALSAHADYGELIAWLSESHVRPRKVFVTHGEPGPADAMRRQLADKLGLAAEVPEDGARYEL